MPYYTQQESYNKKDSSKVAERHGLIRSLIHRQWIFNMVYLLEKHLEVPQEVKYRVTK